MQQPQRVCFMLQVKPEKLEEYRHRHKNVWPEMLDALRAAGWSNYSLFLKEDGTLVGYLETNNFPAALAAMSTREINTRWQLTMAEFFIGGDQAKADQQMRPLEEIFHLD